MTQTAVSAISPMPSAMHAVHYVDQVLQCALALRASDIHLEPISSEAHEVGMGTDAHSLRCRLRIDGYLQAGPSLPAHINAQQVLSHIKVLAGLDTAQQRQAQDGRWMYPHAQRHVDLRLSSLPTVRGEKLVLRILDGSQTLLDFAALGYETDAIQHLEQALARPEGMIIATGPTGSGKSASLYTCLHSLNAMHRNVCSVEDPVEIPLAGVNQVQVNLKAGLGFAQTLRAFLRQDPDVLMVGEIRDEETAEVALKAAQTGHLVLSTLHTNDAPAAITRLRHMGLAPWLLASSICLITAQRLLRRVCTQCARPWTWSEAQAQLPADAFAALHACTESFNTLVPEPQLRGLGPGCPHCSQGYRGRIGVFQLLPLQDADLQDAIAQGATHADIAKLAALQGWRTLRQAAWIKVLQGHTTWQEAMART